MWALASILFTKYAALSFPPYLECVIQSRFPSHRSDSGPGVSDSEGWQDEGNPRPDDES